MRLRFPASLAIITFGVAGLWCCSTDGTQPSDAGSEEAGSISDSTVDDGLPSDSSLADTSPTDAPSADTSDDDASDAGDSALPDDASDADLPDATCGSIDASCDAGCQTHSDGLGQNFYDCVPPGTINDTQATEASQAWMPQTIQELECQYTTSAGGHGSQIYFEDVACVQTTDSCACWAYLDDCTGFHPCPSTQTYHGSGRVRLEPIDAGCLCPVDATGPAWN